MTFSLETRQAVVTGAAHRVGRAIALDLAQAGADVVVHYHQSARAARATCADIEALGRRALPVQADLRAPAGIEALRRACETWGRVDVLVNSAASFLRAPARAITRAEWDEVLALNLTAPFFCAQAIAPLMPAGGVILNLTDTSARRPWVTLPAHSVSKAGLVAVTQTLAKALAPRLRVNAIGLGAMLKPPDWDETRWARLGARALLQRPGSLAAVTSAVRFVIANDYLTGETVWVDGGEHLA